MRVTLATDQKRKLVGALRRAGAREIGGQLYGEQLAPSDFVVTDVAIQRRRGSVTRFFVDLVQTARDAVRFFDRTRHRYSRFNYIGEWHSHPQFAVHPSATDIDTMRALVGDLEFEGSFAVLMIVRLSNNALCAAAWVFDPEGSERRICLETGHAR